MDRGFPSEKIADLGQCFHVVGVPHVCMDATQASLADPGAREESLVFRRAIA